jgi:hypothetical protein
MLGAWLTTRLCIKKLLLRNPKMRIANGLIHDTVENSQIGKNLSWKATAQKVLFDNYYDDDDDVDGRK